MEDPLSERPDTLDGYRLIRLIGRGGFGEVWLCRSEAMGDYRALKWIPSTNKGRLEKEYASLLHYRKAAAALRSPSLLAIEHVGRTDGGLYYVMPLADGVTDTDPTDPGWIPLSLAEKLRGQTELPVWFSSAEVIALMSPVLEGLQILTEAGLVHRDVKPDNILFFQGKPCLGDISLLGMDAPVVTRRGTPGYATPSWYLGGHPDMYGAAATLYTLLSSNEPDKMGRSAFLWPPQGEDSLSPGEHAEWKRLHGVIRRATEEKVSERFVDFAAMRSVLAGRHEAAGPLSGSRTKNRVAVLALLGVAAVAFAIVHHNRPTGKIATNPPTEASSPESPELTPDQKADYQALAGMVLGYTQDGEYANALAAVEELLSTYPQSRTQPAYSVARAMALQGLGRIDEAKEELRKEVNLSPNITAMSSRMDLWEKLGDLEEAENDLSRVIESFGPATFPLFLRADVRAKRNDFAGVQGDREAAYLVNKADSEQRRLVDAMWTPLETKYPGYGGFLLSGQSAPAEPDEVTMKEPSPRAPKIVDMRGQFKSARERVIAVIPAAVSLARSGKVRLDLTERAETNAIQNAFETRNYAKCVELLDTRMESHADLNSKACFMLVKALALKNLELQAESEEVIRYVHGLPIGDLSLEGDLFRELKIRLTLLEGLGQPDHAEKLVTEALSLASGSAKPDNNELVSLFNLRARFRILSGNHAGALADELKARDLPPQQNPELLQSEAEAYQYHLNTIVMQWEMLEQEFPAYASHLEANGWPEPKPDHRNHRAED